MINFRSSTDYTGHNILGPHFMTSLIWNTNPGQMMAIVMITMRMVEEMEDTSNGDDYWVRLGFIKE